MNSLGLDKPPAETRVVVAMSGGVDSSTTAALMAEQGFDVIGVTLKLYDHGEMAGRKGACCAGVDIQDAKRVAKKLGIPHKVFNYESRFKESVIEVFADTYLAGETPIPCVLCNQTVKFRDLLDAARDMGADALATGHYVRRVDAADGPELHQASDAAKDQSYFLFATTKEQLSFLRFPLGEMDKAETRAHAERLGLAVADKPESQDICFVPNGSYAGVVEKLRPGAALPGDIVDLDGNVLGHHDGIINFTVGQRRGLGIAAPEPLYVVRVEADTRRVVAGPKAALLVQEFPVGGINWLGTGDAPEGDIEVNVKIRSTGKPIAATLKVHGGAGATVVLHEPEAGAAPGQACVFYDAERMLGGGWIMRGSGAGPETLDPTP
ncbi:MAG: tRNA 2-thiouridine(34) synthase MnmA [SAR202 cluster bacterium]|nr:tRNA 2-thiouridine(34) synthase MnmA [SAR202 cluster bacterium]